MITRLFEEFWKAGGEGVFFAGLLGAFFAAAMGAALWFSRGRQAHAPDGDLSCPTDMNGAGEDGPMDDGHPF